MPTADDLIAIQNLKGLATSIRNAGQAHAEGQIGAVGIQENRQAADLARADAVAKMREQMHFQAKENEKNRAQTSEEGVANRASREKIAAGKKPINFNIKNTISRIDENAVNDAVDSGLINEDGEVVDTPESQGNVLKKTAINLSGMSDEEFSTAEVKDKFTRNSRDLVANLRKAGHKETSNVLRMAKALEPGKFESKRNYAARLVNLRKGIIEEEIAKRMKKQDFTKEIQGQSLGGVQFRTASSAEQAAQRNRVRPRIVREVNEELGGDLDFHEMFGEDPSPK